MATNVGFLTANAWIDGDGRHVWAAHDCNEGRLVTMLPFPIWRQAGLKVDPSFSCAACGLHTFLVLSIPDEEYRCPDVFSFDGRQCTLASDHAGTHSAGFMSWGTYSR